MRQMNVFLTLTYFLYAGMQAIAQTISFIEHKMVNLKTVLNLNADQETQLRDLFATSFERIQSEIENHPEDRKDMEEFFLMIMEKNNQKLQTILTSGQFEKYLEFQNKRNAEFSALVLQKKLELSQDQYKAIIPIIMQSHSQLRGIRAESGEKQSKKLSLFVKMKQIIEAQDKSIDNLLTDRQKKIYTAVKKERKAKFLEQMNAQK